MFFFYCSDLASPAHMPGTPESHKTETTESGEPTESTKSPTGTYTCVHILCPRLYSLSFIFNSDINFEKYTMYTNIQCTGCKENHFCILPFGQAEASIY